MSEVGDCISENGPLQLALSLVNASTYGYRVLSVASVVLTPGYMVLLVLGYS